MQFGCFSCMQATKVPKKHNMKYPRLCKDIEFCLKAARSLRDQIFFC